VERNLRRSDERVPVVPRPCGRSSCGGSGTQCDWYGVSHSVSITRSSSIRSNARRRRLARPRSETRGSARSRHRAVCSRPRRDRITVARPIRRRLGVQDGFQFLVFDVDVRAARSAVSVSVAGDRCDGITDVSHVFPEYAQIPGTRFGVGLARTRVRFVGHDVVPRRDHSVHAVHRFGLARIDVADIAVRDFASDLFLRRAPEAIAVIGCVTASPVTIFRASSFSTSSVRCSRSSRISGRPQPPHSPRKRVRFRGLLLRPIAVGSIVPSRCLFKVAHFDRPSSRGQDEGKLIAAAFPAVCRHGLLTVHPVCSVENRFDDLLVTGTPAEIVRQRFPHFPSRSDPGSTLSSAFERMIMPGIQKPHWSAELCPRTPAGAGGGDRSASPVLRSLPPSIRRLSRPA